MTCVESYIIICSFGLKKRDKISHHFSSSSFAQSLLIVTEQKRYLGCTYSFSRPVNNPTVSSKRTWLLKCKLQWDDLPL